MRKFFFCVSIFFVLVFLQSFILPKNSNKSKRYNLSICAIFKNEGKYLKEWIEYHRLVGVDHFYLYNNNSTDRSVDVLKPYIKQNLVTLIHWPDCLGKQSEEKAFIWALSTQTSAYENAVQLREKETKWLIFLDVDEFLTPVNDDSFYKILEQYDEYPGVVLQTEFFDASIQDMPPKKNLVIQSLEMTQDPKTNIQKSVEKTIFKPDLCESFTWPPYKCVFKKKQKALKLDDHAIRINQYTNRNKGSLNSQKRKNKISQIPTGANKKALLEAGYEIEDQECLIQRFVPDLLKKMGY